MSGDYDWCLSNPGPDELIVWLEPWAEEFAVPVRSTVAVKVSGRPDGHEVGEIEWASDRVVIWATAKMVEIFIDDVFQDSASAIVPLPEGLRKGMLTLLFANHPSARLGGVTDSEVYKTSWRERLLCWFRLTR